MEKAQRASESDQDEAEQIAAVLGITIPEGTLGVTYRRRILAMAEVLKLSLELEATRSRP